MNEDIFIAPNTERFKKTVSDYEFIKEAVNSYFGGNYKALKGFILEYGEETFFSDLAKYLRAGIWRNVNNEYETFKGIVISFFKMY